MISEGKILDIVEENPSTFYFKLRSEDEGFVSFIKENFRGESFSEKLYLYINGESEKVCNLDGCDEYCTFQNFSKGFSQCCSRECSDKKRSRDAREMRECSICKEEFEVRKKEDKKTCSIECRNEWLSREEVVEERVRKTKKRLKEKYGDETYRNAEKAKKTKKERYGDENYNNAEKMLETKKEKYGEDYEEINNKIKKTKKEKYDDPHYNNREKYKKTLKSRYGIESPLEKDEFKEKRGETLKKRYGDEKYNNREKFLETFRERYDANGWFDTEEGRKVVKRHANKHGFGTEEFCAKMENKYGSSNVWEVDDIREDFLGTIKDKYGDKQISKTQYYRKERRKTEFKKFYKKLQNSDRLNNKVEPLFDLDDYEGVEEYKEYLFKCKKCGEEFKDHLNSGHVPRCLNCYPKRDYSSRAEQEILEFVGNITSCEVIENDKSVLGGKELDVYIPKKDIAIEFNGLYWHSENEGKKDRLYHLKKTQKCEEKGIQLIHIFEDEWINKRNVVKTRLRYLLEEVENSIYARNCEVKIISDRQRENFLDKHHLKGDIKQGETTYGIFDSNKLLSVMTFGSSRFGDYEWEIYRYCSSGVSVVGGAGKMFNKFIEDFNPENIVSYADRRWSKRGDTFYPKLGFEFDGVTDPSYWYMKNHVSRESRMKYQKHKLNEKLNEFDPELTEWEIMQLNGYDRIWDCGNLKFVWREQNF